MMCLERAAWLAGEKFRGRVSSGLGRTFLLCALLVPLAILSGCAGVVSGSSQTTPLPTFSISGTISPSAGGNGATVTLSGASSAATTANSSGSFSFTGLANGSYTVAPSKTGYTFNPGSMIATVNGANVTGISFTDTAVSNPTFSISGTISPSAGGSGAMVTLSGAASASTTANSSGIYSFTGLANGSYTVTPSKSGYTFAPGSANATVNGANVTGINFAATAQTFTISGTISPAANGSGATVTLSGPASATTTANSSGIYTFSGLANGSYAVTPSKTGFTFTPVSTNATVNGANVSGVNFTAAVQTNPTFSISGTISPSAGGSSTTVTLSGAASASTTANSSGNYSFTGLANGSYTVTPAKSGFTFTPASANATVNGANVTGVNFTATAPTFSISGTITPLVGGSGATVTLSGPANATATTDVSGNYTFTGLTNGSYSVTPSNSGFSFTPASQAVSVSGANVTGVNFTAQVAVLPASGAPVLFFSDITSGPATGNTDPTYVNNGGVYVTLYGNSFGAPQGTSTISLNGASCLHVVSWGNTWLWYQKIVVQLTSTCSTGNFVVTTASGTSNGLAFTVRSGNIYYVATNGSDSAAGTFTSPWATLPHAVQTAGTSAGNTIYAENGVHQTADDGQGWGGALTFRTAWCNGSQSAPDAILAYPGATATVGAISGGAGLGISTTDSSAGGGACGGGWTFGGLILRGPTVALLRGPSNYWRVIGNDISNGAQAGGAGGAFETLQAQNNKILGNNFHDMNLGSTNRLAQGLYLSTDSNHSEVGWNIINNSGGRATMQIHSSPLSSGNGYIMFDVQVHDNTFSNSREECLTADTLDPSQGPVLIYNNVLFNCGLDGTADGDMYHPMSSDYDSGTSTGANGTGKGGSGSGTVQVYNNTIYCTAGSACWASNFEVHTNQAFIYNVRNNLLYSNGSVAYWHPGLSSSSAQGGSCSSTDTTTSCPNFAGSNDLVFGDGGPTFTNILSSILNLDPVFTNLAGDDFHLNVGSPASGAGVAIPGLLYDHDGKPRKNPPSVGAYE
jgi:hypothetical protein